MKSKIAITLDEEIVKQLDYLIIQQSYKNRSQAIEEAVLEKLDRLKRDRLARECAKLDPVEERELAEEGFVEDADNWPEYRAVKSAGLIRVPHVAGNRLDDVRYLS